MDLREAFAAASDDYQPGESCPAPAEIHAASHGLLDTPAAFVILDHVSACPHCAEAWRLARLTPAPPRRR